MSDMAKRRRVWLRLGLLAAVLLLAQLAANQYVERAVIQSGPEVVGTQVDVARGHISCLNGQVSLHGLRIADPCAPRYNLIEADQCECSLDSGALLHGQTVIRTGRVRGLQFATPRTDSATLDGTETPDTAPWAAEQGDDSAVVARQWLDQLENRFQQDSSDQLESIRLTDKLLARWPDESAALADRVQQLHQQTAELQSQIEDAQANPLRHAEFLEAMPARIAALRSQRDRLEHEIDALPELADADRRAIVAARREDEHLLEEHLQFDPIDDGVLSAYLMQQQLAEPVGNLFGWLHSMRHILPAEGQPSPAAPQRGEDVLFAGCSRPPKLLVESLDLAGTARFGSQTLDFIGTLTNFVSDPASHDEPLALRLASGGSVPLVLKATIDRTGPVARDECSLECRGLAVPATVLGDSDKLRLSLAPSSATLVARIAIEGEELSGNIQFTQEHVQLSAQVSGDMQDVPLADALDESLRRIDTMQTHIELRGTLDKPQWHITSSLGPALAQATSDAFRQAVRQYATEVVAKSQRTVDEKLAGLDREIAREQASLKPQLAVATALLDEVARRQQEDDRISYERLGSRLPAGSLFR